MKLNSLLTLGWLLLPSTYRIHLFVYRCSILYHLLCYLLTSIPINYCRCFCRHCFPISTLLKKITSYELSLRLTLTVLDGSLSYQCSCPYRMMMIGNLQSCFCQTGKHPRCRTVIEYGITRHRIPFQNLLQNLLRRMGLDRKN
jgi:hypothetical protein